MTDFQPPTLRYPLIGDMVHFYHSLATPPWETGLPPAPAIIAGIEQWGASANTDHVLTLFVMDPDTKAAYFLSGVGFSETPEARKACWPTEDYPGRPEGIVRPEIDNPEE